MRNWRLTRADRYGRTRGRAGALGGRDNVFSYRHDCADLPGYHINCSNKLVPESKSDLAQRGEASPDDADALALTFAQRVVPIEAPPAQLEEYPIFAGLSGIGGGWMG
jgi:hypothetical protein